MVQHSYFNNSHFMLPLPLHTTSCNHDLHHGCNHNNHFHFPRIHTFFGAAAGTDKMSDIRNLARYPTNCFQLSRIITSQIRGLEYISASINFLPPVISSISAVFSLPMFGVSNLIHAVNNLVEQNGVLLSYKKPQNPDTDHHHHHHHHNLPKVLQALFHLPDSAYRYLEERVAPQDPKKLAKLKTCLFYTNLALTTSVTSLGVVVLVGGAGAVAVTPVGWALMTLGAVSTVTFVAYSAVRNKYTNLSRQAYQEAFHLNQEAFHLNQETNQAQQNIDSICEKYNLLKPSDVVAPSFSSYLGLNKPKKVLDACFGKHQQQSEKPTSVSEILLNSALLNFAVTSQIAEEKKKDIINSAQEKFQARDNFSGIFNEKIVDSNRFIYELSTFLAEQEIQEIRSNLSQNNLQNLETKIAEKFAFLNMSTSAPTLKNTGCVSRFYGYLPRFMPKPKEYYNESIKAQLKLACYRETLNTIKKANHNHTQKEPETLQIEDINQFKKEVSSFANPNLYNGNSYLDCLNKKILFGKGSKDYKLTLKGIKELANELSKNIEQNMETENVPPPIPTTDQNRSTKPRRAGFLQPENTCCRNHGCKNHRKDAGIPDNADADIPDNADADIPDNANDKAQKIPLSMVKKPFPQSLTPTQPTNSPRNATTERRIKPLFFCC